MVHDRFARQRQLPEVGDAGQRAIAEAVVRLPEGAAGGAGAEYLRRAGTSDVRVDAAAPPSEFPHASHFRHAPSTELGHGAWLALDHLRSLLGMRP